MLLRTHEMWNEKWSYEQIKVNKDKVYQFELHYLCGIYAASYIYTQCTKTQVLETLPLPTWMYIVGGICVGFGTRMGCGCTSGHGLSGLARFSPRSFVAVGSFFVPAVVVANLVHGLSGDNIEHFERTKSFIFRSCKCF